LAAEAVYTPAEKTFLDAVMTADGTPNAAHVLLSTMGFLMNSLESLIATALSLDSATSGIPPSDAVLLTSNLRLFLAAL
jgi:predicted aspartyl protease